MTPEHRIIREFISGTHCWVTRYTGGWTLYHESDGLIASGLSREEAGRRAVENYPLPDYNC